MTTSLRIIWGLFLVCGLALAQQEQPVPYSHKAHLAMGLACKMCHKNADPGEAMGLPSESVCMGCHRTVKSESPHIQKLTAAAREKAPLPWVRVYKIPAFVFFSHRVHTAQAGVTCDTCHGPVRDRDVIAKEVTHDMKSCVACHESRKAPTECTSCHEERH